MTQYTRKDVEDIISLMHLVFVEINKQECSASLVIQSLLGDVDKLRGALEWYRDNSVTVMRHPDTKETKIMYCNPVNVNKGDIIATDIYYSGDNCGHKAQEALQSTERWK